MPEKIIEITDVNPIEIFGVHDILLKKIKSFFPKLKIVARGTQLKVFGEEEIIEVFEEKLAVMIRHFQKYRKLTENVIEQLMLENGEQIVMGSETDDVILFGNGGVKIKAQTTNQRKIVEAVKKDDMVFAVGPAGTGKTYTAVALAVEALKAKKVKRIVLTRPAVESGENLGFLPGDLKEKLDPYMQPLYDALFDMIPKERLNEFIENDVIQIAPLAFMRGRTLDRAFVILDEAQNATEAQMKMFLTRMGKSAKFIITGDGSQVDLPRQQKSGLIKAMRLLEGVKGISVVKLDGNDVVRHNLVRQIIKAFDVDEKKQ